MAAKILSSHSFCTFKKFEPEISECIWIESHLPVAIPKCPFILVARYIATCHAPNVNLQI